MGHPIHRPQQQFLMPSCIFHWGKVERGGAEGMGREDRGETGWDVK